MPKKIPVLPNDITSTFALIELKKGRKTVAKIVAAGNRIPFTINGYLLGHASNVGNDDGTGIEFAAEVTEVVFDEPEAAPADKSGRFYARVGEIGEDDMVELDEGFTCLPGHGKEGRLTRKRVHCNHAGDLYFDCKEDGPHGLEGQIDDTGTAYIGIYAVK